MGRAVLELLALVLVDVLGGEEVREVSDAREILLSCSSKTRYGTEEVARSVALKCWEERRTSLRAYACTACGGWHLTKRDAEPVMRSNWRYPKRSQRAIAADRKRKRRSR